MASIRDAAIALAQMVKRPYLRDRWDGAWSLLACIPIASFPNLVYASVAMQVHAGANRAGTSIRATAMLQRVVEVDGATGRLS